MALIRRRPILAAISLIAALPSAFAAWPDRPIRIVVTFAAGGASDIVARVIAEPMSKALTAITADPAIVKRFEELGITTVKMSTTEFSGFIAKQVADWQPAIRAADIKP